MHLPGPIKDSRHIPEHWAHATSVPFRQRGRVEIYEQPPQAPPGPQAPSRRGEPGQRRTASPVQRAGAGELAEVVPKMLFENRLERRVPNDKPVDELGCGAGSLGHGEDATSDSGNIC
jgi:hypothetical protein